MKNTELVITGIGVVSPLGIGNEEFWKGLCGGRNCIRDITLFNTNDFKVKRACEITDFNPLDFIEKRHLRTLDRSTRFLIAATQLALEDANIVINEDNTQKIGLVAGSTFGSLHSIFQVDREGLTEGPKYVNPSFFPNTVINSPASQAAIKFKIKGFNTTVSTGLCASFDALIYACDFLRLDRADTVLVAGVEELCEELFTGLYQCGLLSGTDGTVIRSSPFDKNRNGLVLSEGASLIVIEKEEKALKREATMLARIISYANTFSPDGNQSAGLKQAIKQALLSADLSPENIDIVFSSANSTREIDKQEAQAIKELFGKTTPVTAIKSTLGEPCSASGVFLLSSAVNSLTTNYIPPTINHNETDPECDINLTTTIREYPEINNILVIGSDPFGNNAALIIGKI
jgi:3-oxoacyl-[acyl-carrier-protein] synthase II